MKNGLKILGLALAGIVLSTLVLALGATLLQFWLEFMDRMLRR